MISYANVAQVRWWRRRIAACCAAGVSKCVDRAAPKSRRAHPLRVADAIERAYQSFLLLLERVHAFLELAEAGILELVEPGVYPM